MDTALIVKSTSSTENIYVKSPTNQPLSKAMDQGSDDTDIDQSTRVTGIIENGSCENI